LNQFTLAGGDDDKVIKISQPIKVAEMVNEEGSGG
jgi:hypothetical protein